MPTDPCGQQHGKNDTGGKGIDANADVGLGKCPNLTDTTNSATTNTSASTTCCKSPAIRGGGGALRPVRYRHSTPGTAAGS